MSTRRKVFIGLGFYVATIVAFALIFGWSRNDNDHFQPQNEFKLDTWIALPGPFDINKAVVYVILAGILTCVTMIWIANRMQARPNRVQAGVEMLYGLMRDNITRGNLDPKMAATWFPVMGALFLFIWFSNLIGYFPLPTNTEHKVDIFGLDIPAFALFAATANLSIPLVLALAVFVTYNALGIKEKGLLGYMKSFIPAGVPGSGIGGFLFKGFIFLLEFASNFMRLLSLSVRLFANILAGHLIILFMGGAMVILLGIEALGIVSFPLAIALFLFELGLVATLQAFIFATLTAIYLGGAVAESH